MSEIVVRAESGTSRVSIGPLRLETRTACWAGAIVDARFAELFERTVLPVVAVEADEARKTLATCDQALGEMRRAGIRRDDRVVVVGGGFAQDVGTLCASLYMRGIAWDYVPTTLMAMADSCVGGKSSINVGGFKNLAGNLYPPREILVDPAFVATLDEVQVVAGLCEAAKIAFCGGREAFATYLRLVADDWAHDRGGRLVAHVLRVKRTFVEADERDRGARRLLNLGHTFGHALEAATGFAVPHGVAVGVGMLAAAEFARRAGITRGAPDLERHCRDLLKPVAREVSAARDRYDAQRFETAVRADKKHGRSGLRVILPGDDGVAEHELADEPDVVRALGRATISVLERIA